MIAFVLAVVVPILVVLAIELPPMVALVVPPGAVGADVVADDERLIRPVAGLVDVGALAVNVARRDPVGARLNRPVPPPGNPVPVAGFAAPEASDPDVIGTRANAPMFVSRR